MYLTDEQFKQLRFQLFNNIESIPALNENLIRGKRKLKCTKVTKEQMLLVIFICKQYGFKPYKKARKRNGGHERLFTYVEQALDKRTNYEMVLLIFKRLGDTEYSFTISSVIRAHHDGRSIISKSVRLQLHDFS